MVKRRTGAVGTLQEVKVSSSSLWLCDCLSRSLVIQAVMDGNSMGLILDARNVHHENTFSDLSRAILCRSGPLWPGLGDRLCALGRTSQVHSPCHGFA